jgi:hypothetical protein
VHDRCARKSLDFDFATRPNGIHVDSNPIA